MVRISEITSKPDFGLKAAISILCIVLLPWHVGFSPALPLEYHIIYSFFHVNVFHLAVNLLVLWQIKNRLTPVKAFMVAVAASMLPMYVSEPTMGLSGFLFAQFGILWGRTGRWKEAAKKAMPFILFTMLLSNVNGLLHLYAFSIGYIIEYLSKKAAARRE